MATPYSEEVIARATQLLRQTNFGITVVASESLGATNSYAIGKMDAGVARAAFRPDRSTGHRGAGGPRRRLSDPGLDRRPGSRQFGKPVVTTNQATLWAVLRAMGINTPLSGKGRLLADMPEAGAGKRRLRG